jgi:hypothetical protein
MSSKSFGIISFFLVFTFMFLIVSLIGTFYQIGPQKFALIGIQGSDVKGCLGACQTENNNCIGDDATTECQIVQAFYTTATVFIGISLIISISCDLDTRGSFLSICRRHKAISGISILSMILLLISLIIAVELPQGFTGGLPISAFIKKDIIADKDNQQLGEYKEGFFLTVFSIVFLFIVAIAGCSCD